MKKHSRIALIVAACAAVLSGAQHSWADVVSIHPSQDVTLFGNSTTTNNTSSDPGLFVGSDSNSMPRRAIVEFNNALITANIPAGAQITGVSLTLYLAMVAGQGGGSADSTSRDISLSDVTTAWDPSTAVSTTFSGQGAAHLTGDHGASWNDAIYDPTNPTPWTKAGGDFSSTESADILVSENTTAGTNGYTWTDSRMVTDVQNWLNGGTNDGWLLENGSETLKQTFRAFYSEEGALALNTAFQPTLTVTFTPVPEPASLLLLGLAAPALLLHRQKRMAK